MFHLRNPDAWEYPQGLDTMIVQALKEQGISIVAANEAKDWVFVQGNGPRSSCQGVWSISDNGGELLVERVNSDALPSSVPITDRYGRDVQEYALVIVMRLLAVFRR